VLHLVVDTARGLTLNVASAERRVHPFSIVKLQAIGVLKHNQAHTKDLVMMMQRFTIQANTQYCPVKQTMYSHPGFMQYV
jgi:hypothetical protein